MREEAEEAPQRETEKRPWTVSVNRDAVKREKTDPYLRDLYTNEDGITSCQICEDELSFKLANGNYFFVSAEFLRDLKRHHHQNYLALCPNCAAMLMHANDSEGEMMKNFLNMDQDHLNLTLAGRSMTAYFTKTHILDLKAVVEVENQD